MKKKLSNKIFNETNLIILFLLIIFGFCVGWNECCRREFKCKIINDRDIIFQVSTFKSLLAGDFDGIVSYSQLKSKGDFAMGTFDGLDGEMIALNGNFYQIKTDGKAYRVEDSSKAPFAIATFFDEDIKAKVPENIDYKKLCSFLDELTTKDIFYAIKLEGTFSSIKVRSVPKKSKPYPKLLDVIKEQSVFDLKDVKGSIVGFKCPSYIGEVNVIGYHFHFITQDHLYGGHVLDCQIKDGEVFLDETNSFFMTLPKDSDYYKINKDKA